MNTFDVVVIGGGAAGAAAALSAARAGARVALVRRGPGAAALSAGGWQDAPPPAMADALAAAGLELRPCAAHLPHPDGELVSCEVAAASHAMAALAHADRDVLICGIAGLPSFRPAALASLWADAAGLPAGAVRPTTLSLDDTPAGGWSPAALAARLDAAPEKLGDALARAARAEGAARVIVPAVLGLNDHAAVLAAVTGAAGVPVGEALGVAPSVPGWRLDRALVRACVDAGIDVIGGRVLRADIADGRARTVSVQDGAASREVAASAFVLATGKYIGGGITANVEFEEAALGCDVSLERFARTIDDPGAALVLTDPVRTEPQPVLSAGVRVDADGRPLTPSGEVFLSNVFVAGSVRAGVETVGLGLGRAAREGWDAGARAASPASSTGR